MNGGKIIFLGVKTCRGKTSPDIFATPAPTLATIKFYSRFVGGCTRNGSKGSEAETLARPGSFFSRNRYKLLLARVPRPCMPGTGVQHFRRE